MPRAIADSQGSQDSDRFSKDGLARFPSLTLKLYQSPNVTGTTYLSTFRLLNGID